VVENHAYELLAFAGGIDFTLWRKSYAVHRRGIDGYYRGTAGTDSVGSVMLVGKNHASGPGKDKLPNALKPKDATFLPFDPGKAPS
jgi:hypothetical protein